MSNHLLGSRSGPAHSALRALALGCLVCGLCGAETSESPAPGDSSAALRPVRRVDGEDGVTILTNSKRDREPASPAPAARVTRSIAPPPPAILVLPDDAASAQPEHGSGWWLPFALISALAAVSAAGLRRQRPRHRARLLEARPDRTSLPPTPLFSSKDRGEAQWVSQGPPSRRVRG